MGFLDKLFGKSKINDATASTVITESAPLASTQTNTKPKKPRKPTAAKVEEPVAEVQPEVRVLKFDFDPQNPQIGSMELDWNAEFIEMLRQAGYRGVNPEALVDAWLNDIARNIINSSQSADGNKYVSRRDLGDGFSEIR
jgi:hypothetical protein